MGLVRHCGVYVRNRMRAEEDTTGDRRNPAGSGTSRDSADNGGRLVRTVT